MTTGVVELDATRRRFFRACALGAVGAALVFVWMLLIGRLDLFATHLLDGLFDAQAHALLDGHWDVPRRELGFEAFLIDGKSYMYFGPWPAFLRLPIAAVTDSLDGQLTQLSMLGAFAVLMVATSRLLWRVRVLARGTRRASRSELWAAGLFVAVVGAGSVVMFLASRPVVYHETELWGTALAIAAFEAILGFVVEPSGRRLTWAGTLCGLTMLTRGSVGLGPMVALTLVFAARLLLLVADRFRREWLIRPVRWLGLGTGDRDRGYTVPILIALAVPAIAYMYVNYAKFGHLWSVPITRHATTFTDQLRAEIYAGNEGSLFALKYLPTNVLAMFRPDAIGLDRLYPWIDFPGRADVVGNVTFASIDPSSSIPASMPFLFLLSIVGAVAVFRPSRGAPRALAPLRVLVLGGVVGGVGAVSLPYINQRYVSDFLPLLVVLAAAGLFALLGFLDRQGTRRKRAIRVTAVVLVVLAAFSLWANFSFALLYQRLYGPFAPEPERAAFMRFRYELDDRLPGSDAGVEQGPSLPAPRPAGTVFVVGDCDAVYFSDGSAWHGVERNQAGGRYRLLLELQDEPRGSREQLLTAGPANEQDVLSVEHLAGDEVRFVFDSATLGRRLRGDRVSIEPGRPVEVDVVYDPAIGRFSVDLEREQALEVIAPLAGGPVEVAGGVELGPARTPFCDEVLGLR
jgi:hypothetical protein